MSDSRDDRWKRVDDLFSRALDKPEGEREAFLSVECGDDIELIAEIDELLKADAFEDPIDAIVSDAAQKTVAGTADVRIDQDVGNYRLLSLLGEGGMGTVYLAKRSDEQFDQQVAIKVLNAYRPSKGLVQRLRSERQILANLNHVNIAKLLDGGSTDEGLPFIAMEYIDGKPIDQYCDDNRLDVAARLRLFCKVCDAVDYAHRNLIVHRDLKPGNILIDQTGEPKLLDFGIAKILDAESLNQTMAITRQGALLLTPQYASPEQVRGESPAVATDVYSLGVLLYRLLTGHSPYGKSTESPLELERAIVEEDPPKPSTIVITHVEHDSPDEITQDSSAQRNTSPQRLRKRLLGDLDNIVLKALQKDPLRRYATAQILQQDIENYLQDRPVIARPDSLSYRLGKSIRRNRIVVAIGAMFLLTVVGLVSFYTLQLADERDRARLEANRAEQVAEFLTELFEEANPRNNFGEPMNARELLDAGAERIAKDLGQQPELRAALVEVIGESYLKMRENKTLRDYLEPLVGEVEARLGHDHQTVLRLRRMYANAVLNVGEYAKAKPIFVEDYEVWKQQTGPDSLETGIALQRVALVDSHLGNFAESETNFLKTLKILRRHGDAAGEYIADTLMIYGVLLRSVNRIEEEEALLFEALAIHEKRVGKEHADYAGIINNLGTHYLTRGQLETATEYQIQHRDLQKKLVGENGVAYANALMNVATLLQRQVRYEEALATIDEAMTIFGRGYGEDSVRYAYLTENRANVLMDMQRFEESEKSFQVALAIIGGNFGTDHYEYAFTQANYGGLLDRTGRLPESLDQLTAALEINLGTYGDTHRQSISDRIKVANVLRKMERLDMALVHALAAVEAARSVWQEPRPKFVDALSVLAGVYRDRAEYQSAEQLYLEAIEMASQLEGVSLRKVVTLETNYAKGLIMEGREAEARSMLQNRAEQIASFDDTWDRVRENIADVLMHLSAE